MTRVDAPWLRDPAALAVVDALTAQGGADGVRFVGGCVRDALMGRDGGDVDLATTLEPPQVIAALGTAGLKAVPTGVEHGTVTAVSAGRPFEITTLRRDVATDGRRAVVAFTTDWDEDARRRDFRLNALYADRNGAVFDPTKEGVADALAGRIVFVGDARRRIAEDHLRILRFFRFFAWFGRGVPDPEGLAACADMAEGVERLSAERISAELVKLLAAPDPVPAVRAMAEAGILSRVLGTEADVARLARVQPLSADPLVRLSALWPDDRALVAEAARRLRLPRAAWKRLEDAAETLPADAADPSAARRLVYRVGAQAGCDRALKSADLTARDSVLDVARSWTPPRMPVSGRDVARLGVAPGPDTGAVLRAFESSWMADDFPPGDVDARLAAAVSAVRGSAP
ncbi:MAG TPA: CCA tRNA nucleotidyltransferase [Brevundimonas sp.]|jgi:poly(A) polymerase|uniref:CCA tRNA nucleotidyltransferase n=1 Tax=Brevundimonas sp. TaxID=1871086 RepID=UPI002DE5DE8E|nr:CCA tRNA nucleotidyltransferase [Brevundimonas sp.]